MLDERIKIMKEYSISKAIIKMAIPSITGLVVMGLYNMVDTMFVSWIGKEATSAAQVVYPITMVLSSIGLALGIGGGSFISRLLGQNNMDKANQICTTNILLSLTMGILATILSIIFLKPLLVMFGAKESFMAYAEGYGFYIMLGGFATIMNMTLNNLLRAEGSARHSMIAMIIGAVLNIILDPLFIFTFDMGVEGAAIATTISQIVTLILLVAYYIRKKSLLELSIKNIKVEMNILLAIVKIGSPTFARQILVSIALALLNHSAFSYGGEVALASVGIVLKMVMIIMYFIFGLSQGFQPVAGFNYGARRYDRVLEAVYVTIKIGLAFSIITTALSFVFSKQILGLFRPEPTVMDIAQVYLKYALGSLVMMSCSNVISVFYQAIGKAKAALVLSASRQGIFFIPAVLILPRILGLEGVLMAQFVADIGTLVFSIIIMVPSIKRIKRFVNKTERKYIQNGEDC